MACIHSNLKILLSIVVHMKKVQLILAGSHFKISMYFCNLLKLLYLKARTWGFETACISLIVGFVVSIPAYGSGKITQIKLPDSLLPGMQHLLALADPQQQQQFDSARITEILKFVESPKQPDTLYYADKKTGSPSAYHDFDIHCSLTDILKYAFNPVLPRLVTMPSSNRLSYWQQVVNNGHTLPKLWNTFADTDSPIVIRGVEVVENTPDMFSGAYYKYDLNRTLVFFRYNNRKVLISVSKQKDVSDVGNKGYVLGPDGNWDYVYTGKPGLTISGLGWVRSYMYNSSGISVYYELDPAAPMVRCAAFKWIRAGWSRINVVKRSHIYEGILRFSSSYKEILESPDLPDADDLAVYFAKVKALDMDRLRDRMAGYPRILKNRYSHSPPGAKWKPEILDHQEYWENLSKEEMQSLILLEYMKMVLGKAGRDEVAELITP